MIQFESIDKNTGENDQSHTEAYYEELACQEEIYLEERGACTHGLNLREFIKFELRQRIAAAKQIRARRK